MSDNLIDAEADYYEHREKKLTEFGLKNPVREVKKVKEEKYNVKSCTAYYVYDNENKVVMDVAVDFTGSTEARKEMEESMEEFKAKEVGS